MLYLIGGCSRSSKSVFAERMRLRHGIPWFALDALKMGLARGAPALGIDPESDDLVTADRMWPVTRAMLKNLLVDGRDYLMEGPHLRPAAVAGLIAENPTRIRACFLGYPGLTVEAKTELVHRHHGLPNDWIATEDAASIERHLRRWIEISAEQQNECARAGLPFINTGADFETALSAAEKALLNGCKAAHL